MRKKLLHRAGAFAISAVMALTMCSVSGASAFAAGTTGAFSSADTDYLKNGTGNSTAVRQEKAAQTVWGQNSGENALIGSESGVITLGKILNVNQKGKFPNIEDFVYKITPVSAWDNANVDTAKSGAALSKADMPKPDSGSGNMHHQAVNKGVGNDWYSLVSLGNFKENEENTSTAKGSDTASNTDGIADQLRKTRTTDLKFTFAKAGYYMYRIEEAGSIKNGGPITAEAENLRKDVAGVDYDDNTYYVVFYVANMEDAQGNTTDGVYVHTITSWRNDQKTDHKAADLQDSQSLAGAKDLMNSMDHGGNAAGSNIQDSAALGKVGVAPPDSPNALEAYRMWNAQTTCDVVLKKNVTGNLGDRAKQFEFTVRLSGLESEQIYTADKAENGDETSAGVLLQTLAAPAGAGTIAADGKSFTSTADGTATFLVKLRDDECLVLSALPRSASYQVEEAASDHVPQYEIASTNQAKTGNTAVIAKAEDKSIKASNQTLTTAAELVDRYDETVVITYENNRDLATVTGIPGLDEMSYGALAALLLLAAGALIRRRRAYEDAAKFYGAEES